MTIKENLKNLNRNRWFQVLEAANQKLNDKFAIRLVSIVKSQLMDRCTYVLNYL